MIPKPTNIYKTISQMINKSISKLLGRVNSDTPFSYKIPALGTTGIRPAGWSTLQVKSLSKSKNKDVWRFADRSTHNNNQEIGESTGIA